jgi:hypothetical protein
MIKRFALTSVAAVAFCTAMVGAAQAAPTILVASQKLPLCSNFPVIISNPGSYQLGSNFVLPCDKDAFDIRADNVVLDLGGYSIIGQGGSGNGVGVSAASHSNITVKNGSVINMPGSGMLLGGNASVFDVTVSGSGDGPGIEIQNGTVRHVLSTGNDDEGIDVESEHGSSLVVDSNVLFNGSDGIFAFAATISNNTASGNGYSGIECIFCTVLGNTLLGNNADGIAVESGAGTVANNSTTYNGWNGIEGGGQITNNFAGFNWGAGIKADSPSSSINNNVESNMGLGLDSSASGSFPSVIGNNNFYLNDESTSGGHAQTSPSAILMTPNVCDGSVKTTQPC